MLRKSLFCLIVLLFAFFFFFVSLFVSLFVCFFFSEKQKPVEDGRKTTPVTIFLKDITSAYLKKT